MLSFPENPLLKLPKASAPETTGGDDMESLRRKLQAREQALIELKAVITRLHEQIMNLQTQLQNAPEDRRSASITL